MIQWHTQAGNTTTNIKVKIDFTLPALSATNFVTWKCHVDDSAKGRYDVIIGRDLLSELRINLKCSEQVIEAYYGPSKGSKTPMVDSVTYIFKDLNTETIKTE